LLAPMHFLGFASGAFVLWRGSFVSDREFIEK
jgi:hypothetical protein